MDIWNVRLNRRKLPIKVRKILDERSRFVIVLDTLGKQHEISLVDCSPAERAKIKAGSTITLVIAESVLTRIIQPPKIPKSVRKLIFEAQKQASGLFFLWLCEYCSTSGHVEYEDGDESQGIVGRIMAAHQQEAKPGCERLIRIFDHRGMEQKDSELYLSATKVA